VLWNAGHKEGAFILVLVATAATARKRYPRPEKDSISFRRFLSDEMGIITGGPKYNVAFPFQGRDKVPLTEIIYHHLRCQLVHEGEMPHTITFSPPLVHDGQLCNVLKLEDPLGFPEGWVWNLADAVARAPENKAEFA